MGYGFTRGGEVMKENGGMDGREGAIRQGEYDGEGYSAFSFALLEREL